MSITDFVRKTKPCVSY